MIYKVYDNGGESFDRYTVIVGNDMIGMSENPFSPQGFNQYCGEVDKCGLLTERARREALGKRLRKIPAAIVAAIQDRLA